MIEIALGGLGILVALGILVGRLLDRRSRDSAWDRIATYRRINAARARELDEQQARLEGIEERLAARARRLEHRPPPLPVD